MAMASAAAIKSLTPGRTGGRGHFTGFGDRQSTPIFNESGRTNPNDSSNPYIQNLSDAYDKIGRSVSTIFGKSGLGNGSRQSPQGWFKETPIGGARPKITSHSDLNARLASTPGLPPRVPPRPNTSSGSNQSSSRTSGNSTSVNQQGRSGLKFNGKAALAGTYLAGQAIQASAGLGQTAMNNKTSKEMQSQRIDTMWQYNAKHQQALAGVGLPGYLAFSGSGNYEPSYTQVSSGQNKTTSHIPGNPASMPFTGTTSQMGAGWGNVM